MGSLWDYGTILLPLLLTRDTHSVSISGSHACISREVFRDGALGSNGLLIAEELEPCLIPLTTVKLSPCWVLRLEVLSSISQIR
ncbi:hypothetical protein CDAR_392281 [Caerostris darwini]|uniref:Uncharacterized protein n=1 Tax=Caerostris darwini TaxID=1538125 RepID=A0AAV4SP54_9ARAC|nr:hypothetical protein CDAR_392281 [Caerostris darwini]